MDAVPLDRAVLGDSQEEAVELLEALGHPRHPPLADPGRLRARSNCSVRALVVLAYELPDGSVQAGQLQGGHGMMMPRGEMPRQGREYFGVVGVEEPLDLASALGPAEGGVDVGDLQGACSRFEMVNSDVHYLAYVD